MDGDTSLMYFHGRWYDPSAGRFLSADPSGFLGGIDLYAYVNNRPTTVADPLGLWAWYLNPARIHRALITGDPSSSDEVHEAGLRGGAKWMKCYSPIRGIFGFIGAGISPPKGGAAAEGLFLGGLSIDGDGVYLGALEAVSVVRSKTAGPDD